MQIALWPATDRLLHGLAAGARVHRRAPSPRPGSSSREYVSGRGPAAGAANRHAAVRHPARRRLLATRAGSTNDRSAQATFLGNAVAADPHRRGGLPGAAAARQPHRRRPEDSHQALLDVLGLHPTSVEYYPLLADSLEHKSYELSFFGGTLVRAADRACSRTRSRSTCCAGSATRATRSPTC